MKNERILELVYKIKMMLPQEEKNAFEFYSSTPQAIPLGKPSNESIALYLAKLEDEAKKDIAHDTAKQGGKLNRQKAAERVLKSCAKDRRPALQASWINPDGLQCICDGFQAFMLKDHLILPQLPDSLEKLDLKRIVYHNQGEALELPTVDTLKAFIKAEKARLKAKNDKTPPAWDFGAGLPLVNAEMLLNALEILPGCTAYSKSPVTLIYFESVHGCGGVMPIRRAQG